MYLGRQIGNDVLKFASLVPTDANPELQSSRFA